MAGTPTGCVGMYLDERYTSAQAAQIVFKNIYDVMANHPTAEIISLYYGETGTMGDGLGTNYFDEPNSFKAGAFFVVKMPANAGRDYDYYWLCQFSNTQTLSAKALPVAWHDSVGAFTNGRIGFAVCGSSVSGSIPWNGTKLANGTDSKADPVWAITGSVFPLPMSNDTGGARATSKDNLSYFETVVTNNSNIRQLYHFVCDDDKVVFLDSMIASKFIYFGHYDKSAICSGSNTLFMYNSAGTGHIFPPFPLSTTTRSTHSGIVAAVTGSNYVFEYMHDSDPQLQSIDFNGAMLYSAVVQTNIELYSDTIGNRGFLGTWGDENFGICYGISGNTTNSTKTKAYFGTPNAKTNNKVCIPWGGSEPPLTQFSRTGSYF